MITKIGLISGPRVPSIHLGAAGSKMVSTCLTAPNKAGNAAEQTLQILTIIEEHLRSQGSGREKLMMVQVWLADIRDFADFRAVWNEWVLPDHPPALSVIEGAAARRDSLVEIRAYAAL